MARALALLEFPSIAVGVLAVDRMLKKSPVALLRCGTIHPGRYLALVGGSVAATEEAHAEAMATAGDDQLFDEVCLADPHPALTAALGGDRRAPEGDTVGVVELASSPALLRALDRVLKAVPIGLGELRLADDMGGRALAFVDGELADVQEALDMVAAGAGGTAEVLGLSILPRVDETLRRALAGGSRFAACEPLEPADGEKGED